MKSVFLKWKSFAVISTIGFTTFLLSSCKKDFGGNEELIADRASFMIEQQTSSGKFGCYEMVYPIMVNIPEASTPANIQSREELIAVIKNYIMSKRGDHSGGRRGRPNFENQDDYPHPTLVFPVDIINENGETQTVTTAENMKALRENCSSSYFASNHFQGHANNGGSCASFVFPISIQLPDNTIKQATNNSSLKYIIRDWHSSHANSTSHPTLVFPLQVKLKDGSTAIVNTTQEYWAIRKSCH